MHSSSAEISPEKATNSSSARPPEPSPRRSLPVLAIAGAAVLLVAAIAMVIVHRNSSSQGNPVPTSNSAAVAQRTVRLTGTTEAVHMRSTVAPAISVEHAATLTVTKLAASGTRVHKNDVLAEFDRQAQMREFIDKQAEYVDFANKTAEAQAKEIAERAKDETEIRQAESALSKSKLEMQKIELMSKIEAVADSVQQ